MPLGCEAYWTQYRRLQAKIVDGEIIREWFWYHMLQCQACREWWAEQKRLMDQAVHP